MKPVLVYLDSSDYSNFASRAAPGSELADTRGRLIKWRDEGRVEFRYSYAHVLEVSPTDKAYIGAARERMGQIEAFCGRRCFADPQSIIDGEARAIAGEFTPNVRLYREDGSWYPDIFGDAFEFPTAKEALQEHLTKGSRYERRIANSRYFNSGGEIRPEVARQIAAIIPPHWRELTDKFPFPESAFPLFQQYFLGKKPRETIQLALAESLSNLQIFSDWYEKKWDTVSPLSLSLRRGGQNVAQRLLSVRDKVDQLTADQSLRGLSPEAIEIAKGNALSAILAEQPNKFAATILGMESIPRLDPDVTPAIVSFVCSAASVMQLSSFASGNRRNPKSSDAVDFLHAVYLPFVDVFRADGFMASAIKAAHLPFQTAVVGKLADLVHVLEERLGAS